MNKTQCPHCSKVYIISDEQYEASDGIVSCGACHKEFFAAFIDDISSAGESGSEEIQLLGPNYGFDESLNSEISIRFDEDDSEMVVEGRGFDRRPSYSPSQHSVKLSQHEPLVLTELAEGADQKYSENTIIPEDDIQLIEEVDQLIDDKIISSSVASEVADQIEELSVNEIDNESEHHREEKFKIRREKGNLLKTYLLTPIFLTSISILGITLLYQLWLKQIIFWPDNAAFRNVIEPVATPIRQKLEDFDVVFPDRRNLNGLQLLAADIEAHANRASTILLRVSLINRAKISQALPTLELTLTDADGRLVSRRSLDPKDYLYNNRTANTIGSNELKKVTIELLAFPKQATGYELRVLGEATK